MKRIQRTLWVILGLSFFLGLNLWLNPSIAQNPKVKDCYTIVAQADQLYQRGDRQKATPLYRQCKPDFPREKAGPSDIPTPVHNIEELGGGKGLWANALDGIANNLPTKIYFNLMPLTQTYPQFVPAHLKLAEFCHREKEFCQKNAKEGQPTTAGEIIGQVAALYPDDTELLKTQIKLLVEEEQYLEASIAARQFALIYDDYPEAPEMKKLADEYLDEFEGQIRQEVQAQAALCGALNIGKTVLTSDPRQLISGCQILFLLIKGESKMGEEVALGYVNNSKQKGKLIEDTEIVDYVKGLAGRMTQYMGRNFKYEYYVIKNDEINAFALPGGKVFVNTGAILKTNSEAELAGLLGHEISHAIFSHGFRRIANSSLLDNLGQTVPLLDGVTKLASAKYSQDQEHQADILGTRSLAMSGYAADGLRNLMATLRKTSGDYSNDLLATHPAPAERVRYLEKLIVDNKYDRYTFEGVKRYREIQKKIQGLA